MNTSQRYTDHVEIIADLARNFKSIEWQEADVIEWCQHVENRLVPDVDSMVRYIDYELVVENSRALIPCFAHKIEYYRLEEGGTFRITPYFDGAYIDLGSKLRTGKLYITFAGMPINTETGIPYILKGHEQLCYWYCIKSAFTEKYLLGEIDQNRWETIQNNVSMHAVEAQQSLRNWTDDDYRNLTGIMGTSIAYAAYYNRMRNGPKK